MRVRGWEVEALTLLAAVDNNSLFTLKVDFQVVDSQEGSDSTSDDTQPFLHPPNFFPMINAYSLTEVL